MMINIILLAFAIIVTDAALINATKTIKALKSKVERLEEKVKSYEDIREKVF